MIKRYRIFICSFLIIAMLFVLCGCGKNIKEDLSNNSGMRKPQVESNVSTTTKDGKEKISKISQGYGKIIVSKSVSMETLEFDKSVTSITNSILESGGYIEASDIKGRGISGQNYMENRTANISARIPKEKFNSVSASLDKYGVIVSTQVKSENVTSQYIDIEARVKTLKIREERLLELLKSSKRLEDMITLEKELSEVRYEIENLTGSLRNLDNLVEYSTLNIQIHEVQKQTQLKEKPTSLGGKIKDSFISSVNAIAQGIETIIIGFSFILPFSIIGLIIILIIYLISRKVKINKK